MKKPILISQGAGTREGALTSIITAIQRCQDSLPDTAVDDELRELEVLKSAVEERWPLDPKVKNQMNLGPFAAKNLSDWNAELADTLMHLDYELRHDGVSLFMKKPHSEPSVPEHSESLDRAQRA